ncbi:MAG TPA: response regulator transcription factor [Candidatus Acidoferrum sp.]|nr:response regulator transcription factor [Candidatus Acidoferrum sp.]
MRLTFDVERRKLGPTFESYVEAYSARRTNVGPMRGRRILVVDDFEPFRLLVCSLLQQMPDLQVTQASHGFEAIQKAEEIQPDLIVLDISLPRLNGIEVARRVHKLLPAAKIFFLSVESDADLVREALDVGAGYIHKPRVLRDLLPAIEAVLKAEQSLNRPMSYQFESAC